MKENEYPEIGRFYEYHKGGIFEIISLGYDTNTEEEVVIFKSREFGTMFVRPVKEWFVEVDGMIKVPNFSSMSYEEKEGKIPRYKLCKL